MGIRDFAVQAGNKAANRISRLSSLSPEQLQQVQEQREAYLSQMPSPGDSAAEELTRRLLAACSVEIYQAYLSQLRELYVPIRRDAEYGAAFDTARNIRFFNITKWVVDKSENSLEKLVNVYQVLSDEACNISLVFHRTCEDTRVYLAVTNTQNADNNVDSENYRRRLADAVRGNFPGSEWSGEDGIGTPPCLRGDAPYSVAAASNIPTEKSEKFISQTIEKLLDGIVPDTRRKEYILILLATPIRDVEERKLRLAEMYSGLAPYAAWTTSFTYNEQNSSGSSATVGVNIGASAGLQNGQNSAVTGTSGVTDSTGTSETDSTGSGITDTAGQTLTESTGESVTDSTGSSVTNTRGTSESTSSTHAQGTSTGTTQTQGSSDSVGVSTGASLVAEVQGSYNHGWTRSTAQQTGSSISDAVTQGATESVSESIASSTGRAVARSAGTALASSASQAVSSSVGHAVANTLGRAVSRSVAQTAGAFRGMNLGVNFGANFARSSNITATIGKSEGITQSFTNYNIRHALELLENQMKRLEQSTALGMWDFAAYVLSEDLNVASNAAHSYLALTQGEESYLSRSAVNLWRGDMGETSGDAREICGYLRELRHPVFGLNPDLTADSPDYQVYPPIVTAAAGLSGKELAYSLNFPRRSVAGLPVIECAEFGRNVVTYDASAPADGELDMGRIFHMNHTENTPVRLSVESLASHTFITGSTGSGKSNTVYQLLQEALGQGVRFLVIEPAKGEYKHIFGMDDDVFVYGTNPAVTPLLRINPFSFPRGIHILEHLDRLVEIFNVCWPMYAAMPAVLKQAVERAYVGCGWDLTRSVNRYGEDLYPTFTDVAGCIREIIDTSEYDTENKGAYKGSLLTRLQSLTNGINGMIFSCSELTEQELFDRNVIIDLSRVGSSETKSLIMGMLVLKLQEHRMTGASGMNARLQHITVLEEAHNLLRRTAAEVSSESADLTGKSVEMLANAIAEMRTYGEGFVIADQAPGLLDLSVIRNTNTKIILRLPDRSDRELVGRAANLNDDQIMELAKLPRGVAAVYQNEWVQPVLCRVHRFDPPGKPYSYDPGREPQTPDPGETAGSLLDCIMNRELYRRGSPRELSALKRLVVRSGLDVSVKRDFLEYISAGKEDAVDSLRRLLYDFLSAADAINASADCRELTSWVHSVVDGLNPSIKEYSKEQIDLAMALILYEQTLRDTAYNDLLVRFVEIYQAQGGVF